MPSAKPPPPPAPGQPQLRFTSFAPVGFLNGKNVSSSFAKADSQSWFSRRSNEQEWNSAREGKRRRLMASEEEIAEAAAREGAEGAGQVRVGTLVKAPEGGVRAGKGAEAYAPTIVPVDPLSRTIIIHPGSRFLRIGLASSLAPIAVPTVIARKRRGFVPSTSSSAGEKSEQKPLTGHLDGIAAQPVAPTPQQIVAQAQAAGLADGGTGLPPLPSAAGAGEDVPMRSSPLSSPRPSQPAADDDDDGNDSDSSTSSRTPKPPASSDPMEAKIASLRGDLRARMRAYKLRGQGNGNSQAQAYNESVPSEGQDMAEDFEGDIEWTTGKEEVYVGNKAVRIPDPAASGFELRWPYDRGGFSPSGYRSAQELLGDVEAILVGAIEEELGVKREELKDYSAILLIPDLYSATYVREMADLLLRTIGFKQLCLQQESLCATFGAGISSACVVDIGAKTSTITCVEEGLVLPETRMVLDFGGDDITSFLLSLLSRISFPWKDCDLSRWYDWNVIEELKERMVVLSEGDISLNLLDFYVRRPGLTTRKFTMRVYDDCIMAPYALFAPRVIDFDQKKKVEGQPLWSKDVDDNVEFGAVSVTNAMRASTRHLLAPPAGLPQTGQPSSLTAPGMAPSASTGASPAPPSLQNTPQLDDPSSSSFSTLPPSIPSALPSLPSIPPLASTSASASPAPPSTPFVPPKIDVRAESSKLPLDVAVVESIMAAGPAEERMKKVAANLLVVGGTGGIHNVGFAVESRVTPALLSRAPFLSGLISYVPCPKEIEPENLAWKGISALAKLDCANEVWVRKEEWELMGMRAVRERGFYWA